MGSVRICVFMPESTRLPDERLPQPARRDLQAALLRYLILGRTRPYRQPVQMLLEIPGHAPLGASVSLGGVATASVRRTKVSGGKVLGGDLDALGLYLGGLDPAVDELAVTAAERWMDAAGNPLPFPTEWYDQVRAEPRPVLAHLCRTSDAAQDVALLTAAETLGECLSELADDEPD